MQAPQGGSGATDRGAQRAARPEPGRGFRGGSVRWFVDTAENGSSDVPVQPTKLLPVQVVALDMTALSFDDDGVDVVYEGTEFRLEKDLIEEAIQKEYVDVTDHEVLKIIEENPALSGEPQRIGDIVKRA
jgi:hypothetical protein